MLVIAGGLIWERSLSKAIPLCTGKIQLIFSIYIYFLAFRACVPLSTGAANGPIHMYITYILVSKSTPLTVTGPHGQLASWLFPGIPEGSSRTTWSIVLQLWLDGNRLNVTLLRVAKITYLIKWTSFFSLSYFTIAVNVLSHMMTKNSIALCWH